MMRRWMVVGVIGAVFAGGGCTSGDEPDRPDTEKAAAPGLPGLCGRIGSERLLALVPNMTVREAEPSVFPTTTKGATRKERFAKCDVRAPVSAPGTTPTILTIVLAGGIDVETDCPEVEAGAIRGASLIPAAELTGVGDPVCGYVKGTDRQIAVTVLALRDGNDLSVIYSGSTDDAAAARKAVIGFTDAVLDTL
jgi:hypothetical protein